ncbi:hypothetical protein ATZ36_12720 [Candidatus Endomicrobiellum trichonymphae]|jgi:hypothetical protein|uniref:DUF1828 domain-containing protein n=1 Tax=Endomicrobium trichonymphae TaxID=1408204 RepID=A0A1E5IMW4_ENDTX|nr:hypothetical protein ATZ36_12720 [Candidatus Endomicrobium trichonymphae]
MINKTISIKTKDWVEITTPYIDRHNDYIQIYIKKSKGSFILTDYGYTVDDLLLPGVRVRFTKEKKVAKN